MSRRSTKGVERVPQNHGKCAKSEKNIATNLHGQVILCPGRKVCRGDSHLGYRGKTRMAVAYVTLGMRTQPITYLLILTQIEWCQMVETCLLVCLIAQALFEKPLVGVPVVPGWIIPKVRKMVCENRPWREISRPLRL